MCRIYFTLLLGIALLGVGCGRSKTYTGPSGEKATVTEKGDNVDVTFSGKSGEKMHFSSSGQGMSLPDNFPKDAPVYPGATVAMNTTGPEGMMLMLKTNDSMEKVKEFYMSKLKEEGWENVTSVNTPQGIMLANKKDNRNLAVTINSGNETTIHLVVSQEK